MKVKIEIELDTVADAAEIDALLAIIKRIKESKEDNE